MEDGRLRWWMQRAAAFVCAWVRASWQICANTSSRSQNITNPIARAHASVCKVEFVQSARYVRVSRRRLSEEWRGERRNEGTWTKQECCCCQPAIWKRGRGREMRGEGRWRYSVVGIDIQIRKVRERKWLKRRQQRTRKDGATGWDEQTPRGKLSNYAGSVSFLRTLFAPHHPKYQTSFPFIFLPLHSHILSFNDFISFSLHSLDTDFFTHSIILVLGRNHQRHVIRNSLINPTRSSRVVPPTLSTRRSDTLFFFQTLFHFLSTRTRREIQWLLVYSSRIFPLWIFSFSHETRKPFAVSNTSRDKLI